MGHTFVYLLHVTTLSACIECIVYQLYALPEEFLEYPAAKVAQGCTIAPHISDVFCSGDQIFMACWSDPTAGNRWTANAMAVHVG